MAVTSELKTGVNSVTARVKRDGTAVTSLTVQIRDLDHLHKLLSKIEGLQGVRNVYRVTKRERNVAGQ
jgi:GTP pyrophosphokinase